MLKQSKQLLIKFEKIDLTKAELVQAQKPRTADLENANQIECAIKIEKIDFIIARDKKGFKHAPIDVLNADEFLNTELK